MTNRSGRTTGKRLVWDYDGIQSLSEGQTRCYELTDAEVGFLLGIFGHAIWETRWQNYPDFETVLNFVNTVQYKLIAHQECPSPCPPIGGSPGNGGGSIFLPECIEFEETADEFCISIREDCAMPVTVNIFDGCGCGCGGSCGNGSGSGNTPYYGNGGGSWIAEPDTNAIYAGQGLSDCDFVTAALDVVMNSQREFWTTVASAGGDIELILDGLAAGAATFSFGTLTSDGVDWLTDLATDIASGYQSLWLDADFRDDVKASWVKNNPDRSSVDVLTRQQLIALADNIQRIRFVGLTPYQMRPAFRNVSRILDMNKLNARLGGLIGQCNQSAYTYYKALAGVPYTAPTDPNTLPAPDGFPSEAELLAEGFAWAKSFDLTVAPLLENANWTIPLFNGNPQAQWESGAGYKNVPNMQGVPHCWNRLAAQLIGTTAGNVHRIVTKFTYVPNPASANLLCDVWTENLPTVDYINVIRQWDGSNAGNTVLQFDLDYVPNCTVPADQGYARLTKLAVAGTGTEEYPDLQQV